MNKLIEKLDNLPPRLGRIIRMLIISADMALIGFGIYFQLQSDIGLAPWNALSEGISMNSSMTFGVSNILVSMVVLIIDLLIKERIGIGTIIDSFLTGIFIDIFSAAEILPKYEGLQVQIPIFLCGVTLVCLGQAIYMGMGLCLGTRDSLAVGLSKRLTKFSVGTVTNMVFVMVLAISWLLGAPIGIGTVISVFGSGLVLDAVCAILRFDPRDVKQEDIIQSTKVFLGKDN